MEKAATARAKPGSAAAAGAEMRATAGFPETEAPLAVHAEGAADVAAREGAAAAAAPEAGATEWVFAAVRSEAGAAAATRAVARTVVAETAPRRLWRGP